MKRLALLLLPCFPLVLMGCAKERVFNCYDEEPYFAVLVSRLPDSVWVFTECYEKGGDFRKLLLTDSTLLKKKRFLDQQASSTVVSDTAGVGLQLPYRSADTTLWFGNYDWKIKPASGSELTLTEIVQPRTKFVTTDIHGTPECSSPIVQMKVNGQLVTGEAAQKAILIN